MAEKVGDIFFDVDADTGGLLASAKQVDTATDSMGRSIEGVGRRAQGLNTQISRTAKSVNGSFSSMRGSVGQFGFQIQDIAVQLQSGQNALLVFGQQGSQIASIFGPGGAVIGALLAVGAAIGTALLPSLFDAKSASEELEAVIEKLNNTLTRSDDGVIDLSDRIRELASVNREAAQLELDAALERTGQTAKLAGAAIREAFSERTGFFDDFVFGIDEAVEAARNSATAFSTFRIFTRDLGESFGVTGDQAVELGNQIVQSLAEFERSGEPQALVTLQSRLVEIANQSENNSSALKIFIADLDEFFSQARSAAEQAKFLAEGLDSVLASSNKNQLDDFVSSLQKQAETIGFNERELAIWTAQQLNADAAVIKLINSLYDDIDAKKAGIQATKESEQETARAVATYERLVQQLTTQNLELRDSDAAFEAYIQRQREAAIAAGGNADEVERLIRANRALTEEQEAAKKAQSARETLGNQVQGIGLTPLQQLEQQYQNELALLQQAEEQKIQLQVGFEERRAQLQQQYAERRAEILASETQNAIVNFEALGNRAAGALASVAVGAQTGEEAVRSLAVSVLQEAIGSLIKLGIQSVATTLFASSAEEAAKASSAATTAAALAATTAATTTAAGVIAAAWAPAATLASVATLGGAAGTGVAALTSALAAGQAITTAATAANTAISAAGGVLGGGRLNGGAVSAGRMYPLMENGRPEVLQQGSKSYLFTGGKGGNVVSNRELMGGAKPNVNVNINAPAGFTGEASVNMRGNDIDIDARIFEIAPRAVARDMRSRGDTHKAVTDTTTATNRARGR